MGQKGCIAVIKYAESDVLGNIYMKKLIFLKLSQARSIALCREYMDN